MKPFMKAYVVNFISSKSHEFTNCDAKRFIKWNMQF